MIILGATVSRMFYYYHSHGANSRTSSKSLRVPLFLENAQIHELLVKCAFLCSKPGKVKDL